MVYGIYHSANNMVYTMIYNMVCGMVYTIWYMARYIYKVKSLLSTYIPWYISWYIPCGISLELWYIPSKSGVYHGAFQMDIVVLLQE
jgi:hypothetical protein